MGQYYNAAILKKNKKTVKEWVYSWDYGNGLKLMEHSYIGNAYVNAMESLLVENPQRLVWAGDYANQCNGMSSIVYDRCNEKNKVTPNAEMIDSEIYKFVVNHSKKLYVDKTTVDLIDPDDEDWPMRIHPLPLLTCEGNGGGGGDFRGNERGIVGTWARDEISIEKVKPKGYKSLVFDLSE